MIIDRTGRLYSLGQSNQFGVLGRGYEGDRNGEICKIEAVVGLENERVVDVEIS